MKNLCDLCKKGNLPGCSPCKIPLSSIHCCEKHICVKFCNKIEPKKGIKKIPYEKKLIHFQEKNRNISCFYLIPENFELNCLSLKTIPQKGEIYNPH